MKLTDVVEQEDEFTKQKHVLSGTSTNDHMDHLEKQMDALAAYYGRTLTALKPYTTSIMKKPWDAGYKEIHASTPYKGTYCRLENLKWATASGGAKEEMFAIDPATPRIEKIWPRIEELTVRMKKYVNEYTKLLKEYNKWKKKQREEVAQSDEASSVPTATPDEIRAFRKSGEESFKIGKRSISNPLSYCDGSFYMGPPGKYPALSGPMWDIFVKIQKGLKEAGVPPFTILYGGRKKNFINFLMCNDDRSVVWRKYQSSVYGSDNSVYLSNGKKIRANVFAEDPKKWIKP